MTGLAIKALALAGAYCAFGAGAARASVTFDFVQTSASGGDPYATSYPFTGDFEHISLTFTDAQVIAGGTSGTASCSSGPLSCVGIPGFVTSSDAGYGRITANLTFNTDATLSGSIVNRSSQGAFGQGGYDYTLSSSDTSWTGTLLGSDNPRYGEYGAAAGPDACTFTGYFVGSVETTGTTGTVPEPASFAVLSMGLLAPGAVHRGVCLLNRGGARS